VLATVEPLREGAPLLAWLREQPALHLEVPADEKDRRVTRPHQQSATPRGESRRNHGGQRRRRRDPKVLEGLPAELEAAHWLPRAL